ncbi:MAG: nickel-dependent hydrogenase large subunit [Candidatus Thiodiazotropha sp.]
MSIEGKLGIELLCRDNRVRQVRILSSRPLQLPLLFEGKRVTEVLQTIPLLYGICATAQASAAVTACRQALGLGVDERIRLAESMLVWFEMSREHLWRVLIDWPAFIGETVERPQLPGLSRLVPDAQQALFDRTASAFTLQPVARFDPHTLAGQIERLSHTLELAVFGIPAADWHAMESVHELEAWVAAKGTPAARYLAQLTDVGMAQLGETSIEPLPAIEAAPLHQRLAQADADRFIARPEWYETPRETGSLTRQSEHPLIRAMRLRYGRGLLTRLVARLLELASIPCHLTGILHRLGQELEPESVPQATSEPGRGLGVVEAARGRLIHRTCVAGDTIQRYQILAPTEWNFHPAGLVAEGLLGLSRGDESSLRHQARLFINAVDPCVDYGIEFV